MRQYLLKVNKGGTNYTRILWAGSYAEACWKAGVERYPSSYIWTLEPIDVRRPA